MFFVFFCFFLFTLIVWLINWSCVYRGGTRTHVAKYGHAGIRASVELELLLQGTVSLVSYWSWREFRMVRRVLLCLVRTSW